MKEDIASTVMQLLGIRDMTYKPNSLGYRAITNAVNYLQELEAIKSQMEDNDEQGATQEV